MVAVLSESHNPTNPLGVGAARRSGSRRVRIRGHRQKVVVRAEEVGRRRRHAGGRRRGAVAAAAAVGTRPHVGGRRTLQHSRDVKKVVVGW